MVSPAGRAFVDVVARTLGVSPRLSTDDVDALSAARSAVSSAREGEAADRLLRLIRQDRILVTQDVPEARAAFAALLGTEPHGLPAAVTGALENAAPATNVRVARYDLTFDFVEPVDGAYAAQARITLEQAPRGDAILEIDPERLEILAVKSGGKDLTFAARDGRLVIRGPVGRALDVAYRVKPTDDPGGYGLVRDKRSGRMWTLTWPYSTGALFPSTPGPNDGATASLTVRTKTGTKVIGPGAAGTDGRFQIRKPVPAYAIAFYLGRFSLDAEATTGEAAVRAYGFGRTLSKSAARLLVETVSASREYLRAWFGPSTHGRVLNIVATDSALGGMEHAGCPAVTRDQSLEAIREASVHENVHGVFGNGVRIAHYGEYWMSEGFTNYVTYRFFEHADGAATFHKLLERAKGEIRALLDEKTPHPLVGDALAPAAEMFTAAPYQLGPWILRMLEVRFGRSRFDAWLKEWSKDERHLAVTTDAFLGFLKEVSGEDLSEWLTAWSTLRELPTVVDRSRVAGTKAHMHLKSKGRLPPDFALPVVLVGDDGRTFAAHVVPNTPVTLDAGFPIRAVRIDPGREVLCDVIRAATRAQTGLPPV